MKGKAVFARARDARPGLRELPGGPARVAQPSRIDDIREARFDAYRARTGAQAAEPAGDQAAEPTGDQATAPTGNQAAGPTGDQATAPTGGHAVAQAGGQSRGLAETARAALPPSRDPEAWRALNDAAAAYRERLAAARSEAKPAEDRADVTHRGVAAVREALRHRP